MYCSDATKKKPPKTFKVLTLGDNTQIETLYATGMSLTDIGKLLGFDRSTVSRHVARIFETGSYVRKEGNGPKRKTTPQEDRLIFREVKRNRFSSNKDIKVSVPHLQVSERTFVLRLLHKGCVEGPYREVCTVGYEGYSKARGQHNDVGMFCCAWGQSHVSCRWYNEEGTAPFHPRQRDVPVCHGVVP